MSTNKSNKPELRFKGFSDDWEQRKFGEIAATRRGLTYKPGDIVDGGKRVLRSSNINEDTFEICEDDVFVNEGAVNIPYVKNGDILITSANGSSRLVGKHAIVRDIPENCVVHGGFMLLASSDEPEFVNALMSSQWYTRFINVFVAGGNGAIGNLNKNDLDEQIVLVPSTKERKKIGTYFSNLDNLITLHQRKCDNLKIIKKSMLNNLFPKIGEKVPKWRFKGFNNDWEQRKLGEVATFINGRAYSQDELLHNGKYKVLRVGNFYTNDSWYYSDMELDEKYYANDGDLLYTWSATFGPHIWNGGKVIYHYHIWKVDLSDMLEKRFAVQLLEQDKVKILSDKNGSTMVHITKSGMEQKEVLLPSSIAEQTRIGAYFENLDNLITLHQSEVERLKKVKQFFLKKMFV